MFPLHTKCSRKIKKLGVSREGKATVVGVSCLFQSLFALCRNSPLENKEPAIVGGGVGKDRQIMEDWKQESYLL